MVSESGPSAVQDDAPTRADALWYLVGTSTLIVFHVLLGTFALVVAFGLLSVLRADAAWFGIAVAGCLALAVGSFSAYRALALILE